MVSIKDKLYGFKSSLNPQPTQPVPEKTDNNFADLSNTRIVSNTYGSFLLREKRYPLDFIHGLELSAFLDLNPQHFAWVGKAEHLSQMDLADIVFIDTETTGLAGGTGTCAFMIGTGFFENEHFVVRQYFMRDFHEEPAMLYDLQQLLAAHTGLISFNGKSYDLPLLTTRFILNRFDIPWKTYPHLDLLHPSRRMWRYLVDSCTLQSLERHILGFHRVGDIPGYEIPALYFECLRSGQYGPLIPVFKHNVMDILSMVGLTTFLVRIFNTSPLELPLPQLIAVMRAFEDMGAPGKALDYCERSLDHIDGPERIPMLEFHGYLLKKMKRQQETQRIWTEIIALSHRFHPTPFLELAKVYEHHIRDYHKALEIVEQALTQLQLLTDLRGQQTKDWINDFEYRRDRLLKRIKGNKGKE